MSHEARLLVLTALPNMNRLFEDGMHRSVGISSALELVSQRQYKTRLTCATKLKCPR